MNTINYSEYSDDNLIYERSSLAGELANADDADEAEEISKELELVEAEMAKRNLL